MDISGKLNITELAVEYILKTHVVFPFFDTAEFYEYKAVNDVYLFDSRKQNKMSDKLLVTFKP